VRNVASVIARAKAVNAVGDSYGAVSAACALLLEGLRGSLIDLFLAQGTGMVTRTAVPLRSDSISNWPESSWTRSRMPATPTLPMLPGS
jgi:hypothetical protein